MRTHSLPENTPAKQSALTRSTKSRKRSCGNAPAAQNCAGKAKCARSLCPKTRQRSKVRSHAAKNRAGAEKSCGVMQRHGMKPARTPRTAHFRHKKSSNWCRTFRVRLHAPRNHASKAVETLPLPQNAHAVSARKHASEAKCARTLHEIAPPKPWKRSRCPKLRRKSKMRSHAPRKHASKAKCARTLHENTPAKQSALTHSTKSRHRSRGNAPAAPNCAGKAKCVRTLPENTPAKRSALARCRNRASEAKCARTLHKIAQAKLWERSRCPKSRQRSEVRSHAPQNRATEAVETLPLPQIAPEKQNAFALCPKTRQRSKMRSHAAQNRAGVEKSCGVMQRHGMKPARTPRTAHFQHKKIRQLVPDFPRAHGLSTAFRRQKKTTPHNAGPQSLGVAIVFFRCNTSGTRSVYLHLRVCSSNPRTLSGFRRQLPCL